MMSRRRISVKELGKADHHGWLYKKRESRTFLGYKWKKFWFVLKESSLYWYTGTVAEKAEGYIKLKDFFVDRAEECKRKFAIKASHPQVVTLFFAAENIQDMYKWLRKLTAASRKQEDEDITAECYSEASYDEDEVEETAELEVQDTEPVPISSVHDCLPPPRSCSSPYPVLVPLESPVCNTSECTSTDSESWLELSSDSQAPQICISKEAVRQLQDCHSDERPPTDELEMLYLHLKQASLTPCGAPQPLSKRDYRSSFIRRCKNEAINDKLHLVRVLNSTLKAKEADLLAIEQVLAYSELDATKYRQWKSANVLLLEEINHKMRAAEANQSAEPEQTQSSTLMVYSETSV